MVLEILVRPKKVTGKPWEMFFIGAIYSLVGMVLGYWIFRSYVSLVMVAFTAIAAVPFIHRAIELEEKKEKIKKFRPFKEHSKVISMFTFLFLGFVAVFCLFYVVLPKGMVGEIFKAQMETIITVNSAPTGNFISSLTSFASILFNNLKIMLFCLIFSFFYGVGAIFILSWNASVMGAAIGNAIREGLSSNLGGYFHVISMGFLGYFVHGIPEIIAYFIAGLAGGIISVAVIKERFGSKFFIKTSLDSLHLVAFAFVLLVLAALIEVFISPGLL